MHVGGTYPLVTAPCNDTLPTTALFPSSITVGLIIGMHQVTQKYPPMVRQHPNSTCAGPGLTAPSCLPAQSSPAC